MSDVKTGADLLDGFAASDVRLTSNADKAVLLREEKARLHGDFTLAVVRGNWPEIEHLASEMGRVSGELAALGY